MRQNEKVRARRFPIRNKMKTVFKKALTLVKEGNLEELTKLMPHAYSVIDMACKKEIIHLNNASRKKSRLAKELNALQVKAGAGASETPAKTEKVKA